jgi:hypothetical protein
VRLQPLLNQYFRAMRQQVRFFKSSAGFFVGLKPYVVALPSVGVVRAIQRTWVRFGSNLVKEKGLCIAISNL